MKCWELLVLSEDHGTNYFQKFARQRKNHNTIWELKDKDGILFLGFNELSKLGVQHLQDILLELMHANLEENLKIISYFTQLVDEKMNDEIF